MTCILLSLLMFTLSFCCRHLLHHCFQALMDHGVKVASVLANSFSRRCSYIEESDAHVKEKAIQFGFVLGKYPVDGHSDWINNTPWDKHLLHIISLSFLSAIFKWFIKNHLFFLTVGGFLSDAGWYGDAEKVFLSCLQLCTLHSELLHCYRAVECCVRSVSK